jgi:hypothetical protein
VVGSDQPGRFPQTAFGSIPFDGTADAACRGETDPDNQSAIAAVSTLRDDRAFGRDDALGGRQKIGPLPQAFDGWRVAEI